MRKLPSALKWLVACLVAAFVAALAWITIEDFSGGDPRSEVSDSTAVALCSVHADQANPQLVIEEIWKQPAAGDQLSLGMSISFAAPRNKSVPIASKAVVLFQTSRGRLRKSSVWYAEGDRLLYLNIPLTEFKALCATTPST
jgi:hypothetical protein